MLQLPSHRPKRNLVRQNGTENGTRRDLAQSISHITLRRADYASLSELPITAKTPVARMLDAFAAEDYRSRCSKCDRPYWQCNAEWFLRQVLTKEEAATRIEPHLRPRREACSAHLR
jgi:hypothetical protein